MESPLSQRLSLLRENPEFPAALEIAEKLRDAGFSSVLAGGCVRDACLGIQAKDLDLATSARPEDIEKIFPKTLAVGKAFGTMIVVMDKAHFEVTTFRRDGEYLDGRHPVKIEFSDAKEDAKRRDFTINALFCDPFDLELIDYVNGEADLDKKLIRTVGEAQKRFAEDRLRVLRGVRFSSQLGFAIEEKTWASICAFSSQITGVSIERIFQEVFKLLQGAHPLVGMEKLVESGLAKKIWPSLAEFRKGEKWFEFATRVTKLSHPATILAEFLRQTPNKDKFLRDLESWKPPRQFVQKIVLLEKIQTHLWSESSKKIERLRYFASPEWQETLELLEAEATSKGKINELDGWIAEFLGIADKAGNLPKALLNGADLLAMGFKAGPKLGQVLEDLYALQLDGQINSLPQARSQALRLVETSNEV
jgi:poly(A) polymerase